MHSAKFEIECENPELVKKAVEIDDKSEVNYITENKKIIIIIECESLKTLMKIAYSACNRIQLSIETLNKFSK